MICPECKSNEVKVTEGKLVCGDCGHSECLIDFPVSNVWKEHYEGYFERSTVI